MSDKTCSQNFKDMTVYDFSKTFKDTKEFSAISAIVNNIFIILPINIKSLDVWFKYSL